MEANLRTLEQLFGSSVRLLVPLYQRPYVWDKALQWQPLWDDVASVAERLAEALSAGTSPKKAEASVPRHFLGAVVLQSVHTAIGEMDCYSIIDGQQRLTTLQLLIDAVHAELIGLGLREEADLLEALIVNRHKVKKEHDQFKVWPTNNDRAGFVEVMASTPPVAYATLLAHESRVVSAHEFFAGVVRDWIAESPEDANVRLAALTTVLLGMLNVVAIELGPQENAQLIFETLNARNTPLLASDLVKNALFQRLSDEGIETNDVYDAQWRHLDTDYWRQNVATGRLSRPRLDLFLYYWLIARLGRQVKLHEVFPAFREHLDALDDSTAVQGLVRDVSKNSIAYAAMMIEPPTSALGRFRYRVLETMQADVFTPLLIWLRDPTKPALPATALAEALASIESWSVRRMICRLTNKDANKLMLDLIEQLLDVDPADVGSHVRTFLLGQTAESRFWPSDEVVRTALRDGQLYRSLSRARLRMLLEAVEDHLRSGYAEQSAVLGKCSIEHVLPQAWDAYWPYAEGESKETREGLIHTLGNLTLVTSALNSSASNKSWDDKRTALNEHSVLRLNRTLLDTAGSTWNHEQIRDRTSDLSNLVVAIWSR